MSDIDQKGSIAGHGGRRRRVAKRPTAAELESKALTRCDSTAHWSPPGQNRCSHRCSTHPMVVMRENGAQNKNIGARKLSDAHR
jgi:hypothetical protein